MIVNATLLVLNDSGIDIDVGAVTVGAGPATGHGLLSTVLAVVQDRLEKQNVCCEAHAARQGWLIIVGATQILRAKQNTVPEGQGILVSH